MSLTLIKCKNPTQKDLEALRNKVIKGESLSNDDVEIEVMDLKPTALTLVKVGDDNYKPTLTDLESWRDVFEAAIGDPDFKIFTHSAVSVEQLPGPSEDNVIIIGSDMIVVKSQDINKE